MIETRTERSARQRTLAVGLSLAALFVLSLLAARPAEAAPNVFTVDRSDDPDLSTTPVANNCTAAIADDCSLRGAIEKANRTTNDAAGPDEIRFNIPGNGPHTIAPSSTLPPITTPVSIDGYTQPGASERTATNNAVLKIELSGNNAGVASGLTLNAGAGNTTIRGLVINRFDNSGLVIIAENTVIEGNFIGTNPAGDTDLGNGSHGVVILSSTGNLIGGTSAGAKNVISGNSANGVIASGPSASNNRIEGNRIGTNASGTSALGNTNGVNINAASGNFVGGPGAGNLISGNRSRGILIIADATSNSVQSNFIGTDVFVSADLGNGEDGVEIFEGSNNVIGGTASNTGNFISGNNRNGVEINVGASNNRVERNLIGTGQNGRVDLGNGEVGVLVRSSGNFVGGTASGAGNVISGNGGVGVSLLGSGASNNTVQGNHIGTQVDGTTPLPNFHGVFISDASGNLVGGTVSAAANTISGNANHGVSILGDTATGNRILRNSISENGSPEGLGIELNNDGVTDNDTLDPDLGPNLLQNFPNLTSATVSSSGQVTITGNLNSNPSTLVSKKKKKGKKKKKPRAIFIPQVYTVQFFSNPAPNIPTGFGEGQTFIGEATVVTNTAGNAPINLTFTPAQTVSAGEFVTATAMRNATGDTSEFSAARVVQ